MNQPKRFLFTARLAAFVLLAGIGCLVAPQHAAAQINIDGWGLRTSVPAWCILSPSLGVDVSWNGHYMLALDGSYNHGSAPKDNGHGVHLSTIGLEARRYLNPGYRQFYFGADIRRLEFNYKFSSIGRDGWALTTGILAGYTFALPKSWNIDVSAGCGYIHSDYTRYEWYPQKKLYRDLNNRIHNGFALTNLNIAVSYRFKL